MSFSRQRPTHISDAEAIGSYWHIDIFRKACFFFKHMQNFLFTTNFYLGDIDLLTLSLITYHILVGRRENM